MNTRLVLDEVLRDVARFVARLATHRGARTLVADLPDRFFLHLAEALEAQGLSKKLVADMCGLALRSYQKRLQRLAESRTEAGRTLWEAALAHLHERGLVTRAELDRRFGRDDPQVLGSVLHDLVDGGLVFRTGTGATALYRAAKEGELLVGPNDEGAEALVWLSIYRRGPVTFEALLAHHRGLDEAALEPIVEALLADGRITCPAGERSYSCREVVVAERTGAAAAIVDHVHAALTTLGDAITRAPDDALKSWTGGSTYTIDVGPADVHRAEVEALLPRLRAELSDLRRRAEQSAAAPVDRTRITIYLGVSALAPTDLEAPVP